MHLQNIEQYRAALRNHDWSYDYSDDPRVYRAGRLEREALLAKQRVYDPDWSIWNEIAPEGYKRVESK